MASPLDVLLGAQVKDDGVAVTPRRYIDFRTGLTLADDPATDSIQVSATGGGGGVLVGDVNGDADANVVTQITGDTGDVAMIATSLSWGAPGSSQLKVNAVDGAIELWNNAALALKAHSSAPTIANTGSITQIIGGVRHTVRTISGPVTLDSTTKDFIGWVDASAPRTVTLPAPSVGRTFLLVNVGASTVTIARSGSELINGVAANYVVPVANCIVQIVSNGTDWFALPIFDGTAAYVLSSRTINTTAPLTGGGNLSADRTLAVSNATTGAVGVVQLTQDLGGTGALPTVIGLSGALGVVAMHGTAILADAGAGGRLNFTSTGVAVPAGTFSAGTSTAKVLLDSYGAFGATHSAVWLGTAAATTANVALAGDNTSTTINANTRVQIGIGGNIRGIATTNGLRLSAADSSDPTERLEVNGNAIVAGRGTFGSAAGKVFVDNLTGATTTFGSLWGGAISPSATNFAISSDGTAATNINVPTSGKIGFHVQGSAVGNLTSTGLRVGDGTTATDKMEVVGNFRTTAGWIRSTKINSASTLSVADAGLNLETPSGGQGLFVFSFAGSPLGGVRADSSGNFNWQCGPGGYHQFYKSLDTSVPLCNIGSTGIKILGGAGAAASQALDVVGNSTTSGFAQLGTNPAASGQVRIPNNTTLSGRNAANSGDVPIIGTDSSNNIVVAGTTNTTKLLGAQINTTRSVSASMTVDTTTTDYLILVDSTSGTINITLPAATNGRRVKVKRKAGTNNIFLVPAGSELIDGGSSKKVQLLTDGSGAAILPFAEVTGDGTDWYVTSVYSAQVTS